ncbi:hypothetical protein [Marivirga sp.]|uniref:hypothetical protein n=1 Tax=Marivirga sp. TaxID=2018662 RepID=UPI002D80778F|nr:hypothetical protein [Marivirga sp.]HET8859015.1 hypothetical protein [Marivirga sp.]
MGNRISGEYLQKLISQESKGLYELDFESVDLNILQKSINIQSIELSATPKNREDTINAKNIYEAKVGEVNISLESVIRIYTHKELVVDGIEVIDPLLFMTKINPDKKPLKFGRETGELYDVISQYLELLQINYLKVKSGTVNHYPSNFRLKAIDFNVKNFEVSQDKNKKKIFYSEAINLGVSEQSILLPDSIHELSFEGFELSTKDSILNFNNFKITPRKDIDPKKVFQEDNQNVYDIDIPTLELKGINYLKAYEDNFLVVKQVNIPKPKIKIQSVLKSKKQNTESAENSIGASLLALFDLIKINDLKIEEAGLNLTLKGDNQQRFLSDNITIDLYNIELDSTQRDIQNVIHYFENATVEINDYDYLLPDNLHNIKFKKLNFNTLDSTLMVQNLEIKPSRSLDDSTLTQFNLNLPLLEMEGIAHRDIYDNDRIILKNLALRNSSIIITPPYLKNSEEENSIIITPQGLFGILGKYFNEIKLDKFSVLNSDLNVGEIFKGKALNIQSHQLKIDSGFYSWHEIADSTLVNGQELIYTLPIGKFKVGTFQTENNLHSLELTKFNFTDKNLNDIVNINYLNFKGVQLDSILNKKKLELDSITLFNPQIKLSYKDLKSQTNQNNEWELPEKPINILLNKGRLNYQFDEFRNLSIADFDIDLNYQSELKLFQVFAEEIIFKDEKLNHQLSLSELNLPKYGDSLSLLNVEIKPNQLNDTLSLSVKIPEISFKNFNKYALIQNKRFEADSMFSRISQLNYTGIKELKRYFNIQSQEENKYSFAILNSEIELTSSNINLLNLKNKQNQLNSANSKLILRNFNFPQQNKQTLFFADDFIFSNESFHFYTTENDSISIQDLSFNSISRLGTIDEFSFHGSDKETQLTINNIELKDANVTDFFLKNKLNIQELSSAKTTLNLNIKKQEKEILPEKILLPFKSLNINKLLSNDINIKVYHEENERNYYVRKADLLINTLALDSAINVTEIHHHVNSFVFSGKNYRENFGQHYTVTAKNYSFRYPESNFSAFNIKMLSKYDRFEYSKQIEFQNDWFKLDLSSIKLTNLNIDSLLINQKFILNKLELNKGDLTVFRDLNVPLNEDRNVPMPQKLLSELEFAFSIDTVLINSDIHIHIMPKESSGIGTMTINIEEGQLLNLRTHHFKNNKAMVLSAEGKLNKKANFHTKVTFPMPSENSEFHFVGNVGELDLTALNDMLIPLGAIEVRSGYNEQVNINFKGNNEFAEGLMEFRYNNLKIDILDRDTYQSKGFGNNIKTIFANSFVVSSQNPRWFQLQEGNIFYERIKSRSIFNFWAKALLSGAVSSIGINKSKEEAKAYYKENKEVVEEIKE